MAFSAKRLESCGKAIAGILPEAPTSDHDGRYDLDLGSVECTRSRGTGRALHLGTASSPDDGPLGLTRDKTRPARGFRRLIREKTRPTRAKTPIFGHFERADELFRARTHIKLRRTSFFARRARRRGDVETNDTTATAHAGQHETAITTVRPSTATAETDNTFATEKHTKKTHFSPAKAMAVSLEAQPA